MPWSTFQFEVKHKQKNTLINALLPCSTVIKANKKSRSQYFKTKSDRNITTIYKLEVVSMKIKSTANKQSSEKMKNICERFASSWEHAEVSH